MEAERSVVYKILMAAGVDPARFAIGRKGNIVEARNPFRINNPRIYRGRGAFKHSSNSNEKKGMGRGGQGNGTRQDGN